MGICYSCCSGRDKTGEREPLLKKSHKTLPPPRSEIERLADALGAFQAGKFPSQEQCYVIIRNALHSSLLDVEGAVPGSGPISQRGRQVVQDARDVLEALQQFGVDKNSDNVLQDMIFQYRSIHSTPIDVDTVALAHVQNSLLAAGDVPAIIPSAEEMSEDAASIVRAVSTIVGLTITSSAFRAVLNDLLDFTREYVSHAAGEVADVALEVQVAAEDVESAARTTDMSVQSLKGKAKEIVEDVRDVMQGSGTHSNGLAPMRDARTVVFDRVQLILVAAHKDPRYTQALRTFLEIIRNYTAMTRKAVDAISHMSPEDMPQDRLFHLSPHIKQLLKDVRTFLERLASGHPLANLLRLLTTLVDDTLLSPAESSVRLRSHLAAVGRWCDMALQDPAYANSSAGMQAFGTLYDHSLALFQTDTDDPWISDLRRLVDECSVYVRLVQDDVSTKRLVQSVKTLNADFRQLGSETAGARSRWRQETVRDILGYVVPRVLRSLRSLPIMPRVEYKDPVVDVALDSLLLTSTPLTATTSLTPDHFWIQNLSELSVDFANESSDSVITARTRTRMHVDGIRLSAHDVGYYAKYKGLLPYDDEGLLSVDIGAPSAFGQQTRGLEVGVDLDVPEAGEWASGGAFDVVDVRVRIDGLAFTIDRSKHWLFNKMLLQPLSGPTLSLVLSSVLEGQIRSLLEAVSKLLADSRKDAAEAASEPSPQDYLTAFWHHFSGILKSAPPDPNVVEESHTQATVAGVIHTTVTKPANGANSDDEGDETVIAVGGAPQLFPDKGGPHDGHEDTGGVREIVGEVAQDARSAIGSAAVNTHEAVRGAREVRAEMRHSRRRREARQHLDGKTRGWMSDAFDVQRLE
ncbi:hypothetical protein BD626DRAFT_486348 [Schizophyllum amplum]|uniref:HAM1-like N-terminal domain-containing protein n=1 Tax=Schizophyllum amplum TaxID=97359 RepID=A0A550CMD5_9AGAR|nr:hypothetical protein BD626DRAFT_486348 [Auriculariopsis ampla]